MASSSRPQSAKSGGRNAKLSARQLEIQRIIDALSKAIAQHRLPPGTRLIEAQIVEALKANRNHVQGALQRLAMQRIVTIEPNRGAQVAAPSAREAREVFVARRAIERAIVESCSPEQLKRNIQRMREHMETEARASASSDRQAIVRELSNFHKLLADLADNTVLKDILDNLMVRSSLIVSLYQRNDKPECQHDEHCAILAALEAGETERAVSLMDAHLHHLESELQLNDSGRSAVDLQKVLGAG